MTTADLILVAVLLVAVLLLLGIVTWAVRAARDTETPVNHGGGFYGNDLRDCPGHPGKRAGCPDPDCPGRAEDPR